MLRRTRLIILARLLLLLTFGMSGGATHGELASEGQLKAAYLVNFLKYIEWPGNRSSVTICLFGRDSLGSYLAAYEGRLIGGRDLRIRKVSSPEQLADCQELFIPDSEESRVGAVLRWTDRQPVLTVSDINTFVHDGGGVTLVRADGRLQFDINTDALARAGLKPSSQLMRLAREITGVTR